MKVTSLLLILEALPLAEPGSLEWGAFHAPGQARQDVTEIFAALPEPQDGSISSSHLVTNLTEQRAGRVSEERDTPRLFWYMGTYYTAFGDLTSDLVQARYLKDPELLAAASSGFMPSCPSSIRERRLFESSVMLPISSLKNSPASSLKSGGKQSLPSASRDIYIVKHVKLKVQQSV